jgi:ketosteroid isomerase-like protein
MYARAVSILTSLFYLCLLQPVRAAAVNCNVTYPNTLNTSYPNQAQICTIFSHAAGANANYSAFFAQVVDNVNWTIEGTHPLAGQYNNKTVLEAAFVRIDATGSKASPLIISIMNIIGGGAEQWSVQELEVTGICKNGKFITHPTKLRKSCLAPWNNLQTGLVFDNRYAWATRWNTAGFIVEARAYLDSTLVTAAINLNEAGLFKYSDLRPHITPFLTLSQAELVEAKGLQNLTGEEP